MNEQVADTKIYHVPQPTPEYVRAFAGLSSGTPWAPTDPSVMQTLYGGLWLALHTYNQVEPQRRSNDANEPFSAEMQFIRGDLPPNAFAFHNGVAYCIGITLTLFILLEHAAFRLLRNDVLNEILYEEDLDKLRELVRVSGGTPLDRSRMSLLYFAWVDVPEAVLARREEYIDLFLEGAKLSERAWHDAELLRNFALEYVLHHEVGHIVCGHVGLLRAEIGAAVLSEAIEHGAEDAWAQRRWRMEFEADRYAGRVLFQSSASHQLLSRQSAFPKTHGQIAVLQLLALLLVQTAFAQAGPLRNLHQYTGDPDRFVEDKMTKEGRYPSPSMRLSCTLSEYMGRLESVCEDGEFGYTKEIFDEVAAKHNALFLWLAHHHNEFALMGLAATSKSDALGDEFWRAIADDESLAESCRPFAFL